MNLHDKIEQFSAKFDSLVTKLDTWIASRKPNEVKIMAIAIPALLIGLDYYFVIPHAQNLSARSEGEYQHILRELTEYRMGGGKEEVEQLRTTVGGLSTDIGRLVASEEYLQSRLSELDHLYFSRVEWANHLGFITKKATDYSVVIDMQENSVPAGTTGFGPVMEVNMRGDGGFNSVMRYLYLIEASEKIMPIEQVKLTIDNDARLAFEAKSVLWGLK
ncbi:hypothetical protein FACS1894103_4540 [Campylobacterota bacterium]|nr:hypothetical protein FACS1894103_4540 [Campylobacterota bacterium]